ncbi:MAG: ABC transporter ATP-binding protein [Gammaproteobacteria bacterium]|nr:ABC transporter ATP-binding protein [Gammaproteobacteria bacterium]
MSEAAAPTETGNVVDRFVGEHHHDDRIDVDTEITSAEALKLLWRCLGLLGEAKALFAAKFALQTGTLFFQLFTPWIAKIVIDNVILQEPIGGTDVPYPPFIQPIVAFLDGMTPLEIMFAVAMGYLAGLILVGMRAGDGIEVSLFGSSLTGQDETASAENKISGSYSESGGAWGLAEYAIGVRLNQRLANHLRTRLFRRLTRLPMAVLAEKRTGDSLYRVLYDTASIPWGALDPTLTLGTTILTGLVNMYLIQYSYEATAPQLVWLAWATLPLVFAVTFPASKLMRRINQTKRSAGSATTNAMEETVGSIDAVQSLGGMRAEAQKFATRSLESYFRERVALVLGLVLFIGAAVAVTGIALWVVIIVTDGIIEGSMSPGDFGVLFGMFFGIVFVPIEIGSFWLNLQTKLAPARRIFFFIDYASDDDRTGGRRITTIAQRVEIDQVDYVHPGGRPALSGVSLEMRVGEIVAIVGPSGAGKTTLGSLIPGFLNPTRGRVLIDGRDLASLDIDSVRSHVAYVFQEHLLLAESIRENLQLANAAATEEDMLRALELAGCMSFVREMSEGIDTALGLSGNTLSVGQQQRLCIARGLVRDAKVLILDEPTSALDPETEQELFDSLDRIAEDRLLVVIAHRLSTIRRADKIAFLDDGVLLEIGSHDELMQREDGAYRRFVELPS